jgi:hypothetical protein
MDAVQHSTFYEGAWPRIRLEYIDSVCHPLKWERNAPYYVAVQQFVYEGSRSARFPILLLNYE